MGIAVWWFGSPWVAKPADENDGVFRLQAPAFYQNAHAEGTAIASLFDDVAGIAAYHAVPGGLNPQTVKEILRTVEQETADYVIGTMAFTEFENENLDPHIYAHKDGWLLVYYLKDLPVASIVDWPRTTDGNLVTTLDTALRRVTDHLQMSPPVSSYYHFAFPNATSLTIAADLVGTHNSDSIQAVLPQGITYFERSWSGACLILPSPLIVKLLVELDGNLLRNIDCFNGFRPYAELLTASQLTVNVVHDFTASSRYYSGYFSVGFVFREP